MTAAGMNSDEQIITSYLNSIDFTEYPQGNWLSYSGPGFYTTATNSFQKVIPFDSKGIMQNESIHYFSYDSIQSVSYDVIKQSFPKYYWRDSDTNFYNEHLYRLDKDTIIEKNISSNGSLKGIDVLYSEHDMNTNQKTRVFVNGDTLYT